MILKETLRKIVKSQRADLLSREGGVPREALKQLNANMPFALILSGIRRCGKSTLLLQLTKKIKKFYYFNFEDTKLVGFDVSDFDKLNEIFAEEFGPANYYFFDEIQNIARWELFVRAMLDKGKHFVITGSNASLLSKELGTRLTGRHLRYELFPFSFEEFLNFTNKKPGLASFQEYFIKGGFPEYLKFSRSEVLQELLSDIVMRDIAARHKIKNTNILKGLASYLLTNVGKEFSYNSLKNMFALGSVNSIISFISFFEDAYLLFSIPKFDYSLKKQIVNPKKIYSIDNGLAAANSASFSEDRGRMLENLVFVNLRKNYKNIFYFVNNNECDFIIKEGAIVSQAIQVCFELNEDNKSREFAGLLEALQKFKLKSGLILTYNQTDKFEADGKLIKVMPVWQWLLSI